MARPVRVRAFARACGYEAKTGALGAQVLSHYGVVFSESDAAQPEMDPDREELQRLLSRYRQLVEQRVRERNRLDKGLSGSVGKLTRRHIRWLDREIERLDEEYKELLKHNASLGETVELYRIIPGMGPLSVATLITNLPELGRWDERALTSSVGPVPWPRDSGKKRGNRSIRGVVARCAVRCISVHGWCSALMRSARLLSASPGARKLLMQLNSVVRRGTAWIKQHTNNRVPLQDFPA